MIRFIPQRIRSCNPLSANELERYPTQGALRWLFLVRLTMVVGLTLLFSPEANDPLIAQSDTHLAWRVLLGYAPLVLISGLGLHSRWPTRRHQVYFAVCVDILVITLLMHAAGGVVSGLGILLAVAVAAGALTMEGRMSLLFAALASLAVIAQQTYAASLGASPAFTQAGLLGLLLFAVAIVSQLLYRRIRAAEALAARRQVDIDDLSKLNAFIIENMNTGIMVVDDRHHLRLMNQAARKLLETAYAAPGMALERLAPELAVWLEWTLRATERQPHGILSLGERELRASAKLLGTEPASGVLIYLRDNLEVSAEAQQIKLASLGTLTASIAHNIRNPLSAISHAAQLIAEGRLGEDERHLLDIIARNSARIDEIISSVLHLSRRDRMELHRIDLEAWLAEFAIEFRESRHLAPSRVRIKRLASPPKVELDPRHLHQIVSNLCENALVHASTPEHPATIELRVSVTGAPDHRRALLEVRDDGPGIAAHLVADIFNPFFTTIASGTGLGLYIARELAESNEIRLGYRGLEPRGSCFELWFATAEEDRIG